MENKIKTALKGLAGIALVTAGFFVGNSNKEIPQTNIDFIRMEDNKYVLRIYNPKEGMVDGVQITNENDSRDYVTQGTRESYSKKTFEHNNPQIQITIDDTRRYPFRGF